MKAVDIHLIDSISRVSGKSKGKRECVPYRENCLPESVHPEVEVDRFLVNPCRLSIDPITIPRLTGIGRQDVFVADTILSCSEMDEVPPILAQSEKREQG
ncbi:hypothetical protein [Leptospirillum ferriphilum]|uniref:hypothetical protein n=1 Tax=Leptospirillum ferriphilum TaxID=178606 RepID=UPI0016515DB7|nr:hypothetical protein [Leptospirillum ferriphilum]